jgi:hypothetical protein
VKAVLSVPQCQGTGQKPGGVFTDSSECTPVMDLA